MVCVKQTRGRKQQLTKKKERKPLFSLDQKPPDIPEKVETAQQQHQKCNFSVNTIYIQKTQRASKKNKLTVGVYRFFSEKNRSYRFPLIID